VADEARATYQDGILRVELPLADVEARSRTVPIERGGDETPLSDGISRRGALP